MHEEEKFMRKNRFVIGVVLGMGLAVAGGSVEAKEKSFHAHFAGTDTSTSEISFLGTTPGADYITVAGNSTLGAYTAQAVSAWQLDNKTCTPPDGGSGVEIAEVAEVFALSFIATGEQLFLNLSPGQVACCSDTGVCGPGQVTFAVNGGTGRFAGATGTIVKTVTVLGWRRRTAP